MERRLSAEERALWARVMATVKPMPGREQTKPLPLGGGVGGGAVPQASQPVARPHPNPSPKGEGLKKVAPAPTPGTTLDGSWDKRLSRGMVQPDATVDLHGHTLNSAYAMLDDALGRSIARGDRVILLITGKPPRPDSERPHARGAIRAAAGDWLHASRHADSIAAVRGANPRHGGSGALYIVLRRPRGARIS
ncbi:Smr/MutS family protein [Sphingomonas mali]|uniref:Smr/MutS family protein n=1 Tax=Sphingomonas mali TaxID=40682 RepID=UPI000AB35E21|nr:Smr/MutS family protein [Sphingomonas mali]